ncbi:MAG: hypothetical protein GY913_09900 [Proteobacteria bacterium]|nr:hypothetical protein [Pseudomonadota bacterium]MCP4917225.1 hypothetical protein [Pseudomonadota bacterium]
MLLLLALSCAHTGSKRHVCHEVPKRVIYVPKDCTATFVRETKELSFSTQDSLVALGLAVKADAQLSRSVGALTEKLDQVTVQYQDTLIALCQAQLMDPCNQAMNDRLIDVRLAAAEQFAEARLAITTATAEAEAAKGPDAVLASLARATNAAEKAASLLENP